MSIKIHSTNDNNHNNVILDKYCFNIIIISVRNISSIEKRYDNETTGKRCSSFLLNSNKIRSLPLTRFQTSLPRGTATTLIKFFHWNIHGGAKWSPAPHLPFAFRLYVYIYISFSAFFPSSRLSRAPSAVIPTCNNPLESGETTNIRRVYPRQRQRRVIMHVPNALPAFKQPSSSLPRWQTITTVSSRLRGTNAPSARPIYRRQCRATRHFRLN